MKYIILILPFLISSIISTQKTNIICNSNDDCAEYNAECISGECACLDNDIYDKIGKYCSPIVTDIECTIENNVCDDFGAECKSGKCECENYLYLNEYKTKCLQILNDITCTNNDDC